MTDKDRFSLRPPVFSKRFLAVAQLALVAAPRAALSALLTLLQGKKLRAWNLLCAAAQENRNNYAAWISVAEPGAIGRWLAGETPQESACPPIIVLVLGGPDAAATEKTRLAMQSTFGKSAEVFVLPSAAGNQPDLASILADRPGGWIMPITAGDRVSSALIKVAPLAMRARDSLIYWDEDRLEQGARCDPWVKPDWDPLLFQAHGGLLGCALLRGEAVLSILGDCTDDWDWSGLCFAVAQMGARHVPLILTHRGFQPKPVAAAPVPDPQTWPMVSIIVATKDLPEHLANCLNGLGQLNYPGVVETILVDNGSADPAALSLLDACEARPNTTVLRIPGPFNFSALNNAAVRQAKGDLLCLLNNDVEPLDGDWLTVMAKHAAQPGVGAVGAMLLYPDGTIQHAGVAIGLGGAAGHVQKGVVPETSLHRHWTSSTRRVSAVTAACLVVNRASFDAVGGFDEAAFAVAFNDVDLCLKLDRAGLQNRYVAEARLIHHESKSRGQDDSDEKRLRFSGELQRLQERWHTQTFQDPWHSPLFARSSERCTLQF